MLYQKYSPKDFDEVVGQNTIVKELQKRALEGSIPNVIYLTGYTGTGKNVIGRIIAKYILCENKIDGKPCLTCATCKSIHNENPLLNYQEFNASNLGIDGMREIEEQSMRKSSFTNSKNKIFYIDELQEMASKSKGAVKNLLVLLQKPSKTNYFILGSMDDSKIDKAIKNRAVIYKLNNINYDDIAKRLNYICEKENFKIDTRDKANVLLQISENCEGSMRTAISMLERVIYSNITDIDTLTKELGIINSTTTNELIKKLLDKDMSALSFDFTEDIIISILRNLSMLHKEDIPIYQKRQVAVLKQMNFNKDNILSLLSVCLEILRLPYTSKTLIDGYLVKYILGE